MEITKKYIPTKVRSQVLALKDTLHTCKDCVYFNEDGLLNYEQFIFAKEIVNAPPGSKEENSRGNKIKAAIEYEKISKEVREEYNFGFFIPKVKEVDESLIKKDAETLNLIYDIIFNDAEIVVYDYLYSQWMESASKYQKAIIQERAAKKELDNSFTALCKKVYDLEELSSLLIYGVINNVSQAAIRETLIKKDISPDDIIFPEDMDEDTKQICLDSFNFCIGCDQEGLLEKIYQETV